MQKHGDAKDRLVLQKQQSSLEHGKMKNSVVRKVCKAKDYGLYIFRKVIATWKGHCVKDSNTGSKEMNHKHVLAVPPRGNQQRRQIDSVRVKEVGNKQKVDFKECSEYVKPKVMERTPGARDMVNDWMMVLFIQMWMVRRESKRNTVSPLVAVHVF